MPVKPVPPGIGGIVVGVEVAAGCEVGSVVVVGEGDAGWPEAPGALSKGNSFMGLRTCSRPSSAMPSASFSLSCSFFSESPPPAESPLKAALNSSIDPSACWSTGPCKGTESNA